MLSDVVNALSESLTQLIDTFGLPGILIMAFMENLFPPTPSEYIYPLVGKSAADGDISLYLSIIVALIGSLIGSLIFYAIGYYLGPDRVRDGIARYGTVHLWRWSITLVTVSAYDRALGWFEKRGGLTIIIGRNLPFIHSAVSIPAGVVRMPLPSFIMYTTIGVSLWIIPLILFGYWLGSNWEQVLEWLNVYEYLWYAVIVCALVWWVSKRLLSHRTHDTSSTDTPGEPM